MRSPWRIECKRLSHRLLSIDALANHLSVDLLVDTGAAYSSITPQIAARSRLTIIGGQSVFLGGSIGMSYPEVGLIKLRVGTLEVSNFRVLVMSFDPNLGIDGILGMDFLHRFRFTIEPDTATLVLRSLKKREGTWLTISSTSSRQVSRITI